MHPSLKDRFDWDLQGVVGRRCTLRRTSNVRPTLSRPSGALFAPGIYGETTATVNVKK